MTVEEGRWALQLISEIGVGIAARRARAVEDAKVKRNKEQQRGPRRRR